ncbi:hypothetical protein GQ53DRAFT_339188 [Thozetella sp. PMI_491]|nr:hypothetical protein GQ53DRAFT_339188 [Thozetella sp. PMI_491]
MGEGDVRGGEEWNDDNPSFHPRLLLVALAGLRTKMPKNASFCFVHIRAAGPPVGSRWRRSFPQLGSPVEIARCGADRAMRGAPDALPTDPSSPPSIGDIGEAAGLNSRRRRPPGEPLPCWFPFRYDASSGLVWGAWPLNRRNEVTHSALSPPSPFLECSSTIQQLKRHPTHTLTTLATFTTLTTHTLNSPAHAPIRTPHKKCKQPAGRPSCFPGSF